MSYIKFIPPQTTELINSVKRNDIQAVKSFIDKGYSITTKDSDGFPAIYYAIKQRNIAIVKLLLEVTFDINEQIKGTSLLHQAAFNGLLEVIKILLERGARLNDHDLVNEYTPLTYAIVGEHFETVEYLLDTGAEVNSVGPISKNTPLHIAAKYGYSKMVELLLNNGALKNKTNSNNDTALTLALKFKALNQTEAISSTIKYFDTIKLLVNNGAAIKESDVVSAIKTCDFNIATILVSEYIKSGKIISSYVINALHEFNHPELFDIVFSLLPANTTFNNIDRNLIDDFPLQIVQNGLDTMIRNKEGSITTFKKQLAVKIFDYLNYKVSKFSNFLKLNLNSEHGNLKLICTNCNDDQPYNKTIGLYPNGIHEEKEIHDKDTQLIFYIDNNQARSVFNFLQEANEDCYQGKKAACRYDSTQHNCIDFLQDAYLAAGFKGDFYDFITEEQLGFNDIIISSPNDLYKYKAKGYLYARKHQMINTIKLVVKTYETAQFIQDAYNSVTSNIFSLIGLNEYPQLDH